MSFSKTSTETLPSKTQKTLKNPKTKYVKEKSFNKFDILYINEKFLKCFIQ